MKKWSPSPICEATLRAAAALVRGWPELRYSEIRSIVIHSVYYAWASALGMLAPSLELVLEPYAGASLDEMLAALRSLPFAELTTEEFGSATEVLSGYAIKAGHLVATNDRRKTGVHFTPRSLTEPIVATTLRPLFALVPADRTLELRMCDPSVGGGAFLLELVRQLGARVLEARLAGSLDEAKRLAAIHCAYGVDVCPFAVASAKMALRLECRADQMPWDWLDDNIKVGDALCGLTNDPIARFHWSPSGKDKKGNDILPVPEIQAELKGFMDAAAAERKARIEKLAQAASY